MSSEYIEELNAFLSGEISSVETYELALEKMDDADIRQSMLKCQMSHADRVAKLTAEVRNLNGEPAKSAGIWGGFEKMTQGSASTEQDALALMELAEAERLVQYEAQQSLVSEFVRAIVVDTLLPAQHETHLTVSTLLKNREPSSVS
ncbi:MAG: DUF2383 domain-containing protein [Candidatus Melainabacteria bacterium]|nr:DUF2383 domain-containing protein [Candidatus Melainabacteria bacterium]